MFCSHGAGYLVPWDRVKEYMHVETPAAVRAKTGECGANEELEEAGTLPEGEHQGPDQKNRSRGMSGAASGSSWTDDKELEAIFIRTFGEQKRRNPNQDGRARCPASLSLQKTGGI